MKIGPVRKAVVSGLVALTGSLAVGAADNHLTMGEMFASLAVATAAVGTVYKVGNKP